MDETTQPGPGLAKKAAFSAVVLVAFVLLLEIAAVVLPWQRLVARDHPVADGTSVVLLAIGDSLTYGDGVGEHGAYPAQLKRDLHTRGLTHVDVLNMGAQGAHSFAAAEQVRTAAGSLPAGVRPVVLWMVGHNDFIEYRWTKPDSHDTPPPAQAAQAQPPSAGFKLPRSLRILFWGIGAATGEMPFTELGVDKITKYQQNLDRAQRAVNEMGGSMVLMTYLVPGEPTPDMPERQRQIFAANRVMDLRINTMVRDSAEKRGLAVIDLEARIEVPPSGTPTGSSIQSISPRWGTSGSHTRSVRVS